VRRVLSTFCASVSMLLCVATCALWARSYWATDYVGRGDHDAGGWVGALSMSGIIRFERGSYAGARRGWTRETAPPSSLRPEVEARDRSGGELLHRLGFAYAHIDYGRSQLRRALYVPHWSLVLVTAVLPLAWIVRWVRRRGRTEGRLCQFCGYDLRATPDRCPECGAVPLVR
jgi:hypothetical protein